MGGKQDAAKCGTRSIAPRWFAARGRSHPCGVTHPRMQGPALALMATAFMATATAQTPERRNWFNDPFEQATHGRAGCPVPEGPLQTEAEQKREAHYRIERGTMCWLAKKCEEPNAYQRDHEINAAAVAALRAEPRLQNTSLWTTTQRKFVFVQGCVHSPAQSRLIVDTVKAVPRVEHVVDELLVGTRGKAPYAVAPSN